LCSVRNRSSGFAREELQSPRTYNLIAMFFLLLAQAPAPSPAGAGSGLISMLPFVFIFVIMYYVMLRPQMRRQKEQAKLVASLKTGDRVVTASGIHGLISNVKEKTVIVKVADNVKLEMEKTAVTNVLKSAE
jgi:preprotein translocase subunit YajC